MKGEAPQDGDFKGKTGKVSIYFDSIYFGSIYFDFKKEKTGKGSIYFDSIN